MMFMGTKVTLELDAIYNAMLLGRLLMVCCVVYEALRQD
jgi:hypothetical protein